MTVGERVFEGGPAALFPTIGETVQKAVLPLERGDHGYTRGAAEGSGEASEETGGEEDCVGRIGERSHPFEKFFDLLGLVPVLTTQHGMCELAGGRGAGHG